MTSADRGAPVDDRTAATIGFVATSGALGLAGAIWALTQPDGALLATLALLASTLASAGVAALHVAFRDEGGIPK